MTKCQCMQTDNLDTDPALPLALEAECPVPVNEKFI